MVNRTEKDIRHFTWEGEKEHIVRWEDVPHPKKREGFWEAVMEIPYFVSVPLCYRSIIRSKYGTREQMGFKHGWSRYSL